MSEPESDYDGDAAKSCAQRVRTPRVGEAICRWRARLGPAHVDEADAAQSRYGACTTGLERRIAAALRPASRDDVAATITIAADCMPAYPISTGHNWGYGTTFRWLTTAPSWICLV